MSNHDHKSLRIGITLGDVNGIGPELILKGFQDQTIRDLGTPILYGSGRALQIYRKIYDLQKFHYNIIQSPSQAQPRRLNLIEVAPELEKVDIGQPTEAAGQVSLLALQRAIADAQHQELDVLVTLPVDKSTVQKAQADFVGHTEMLAQAFNVSNNLMMMVSDDMTVGLVTNHLPIAQVAANLTVERIVAKIKLMDYSLRTDFSVERPLIAVLGLNPHAGDNGLIGEEEEMISKAVSQLYREGLMVTGPYPADGFFGNLQYRKFDGIIAMYHDQGLIPFKLLTGFGGVNFTAGMPIIRTSPDHGVAYDIAGKGLADVTSFREAMYMAADAFDRRVENMAMKANTLKVNMNRERERD